MKTNLSALMNLIAEEEKKYSSLTSSIKYYVYTTTIQELDGRTNIIEDNKADFDEMLVQIQELASKISILKGILYEKNNTLKLSDGRNIQTAIVSNTTLRKLKSTLENLVSHKNSKERMTEVNNSYFIVKEVNYTAEELKLKIKELESTIQRTDFEISKLNSEEFEVNI